MIIGDCWCHVSKVQAFKQRLRWFDLFKCNDVIAWHCGTGVKLCTRLCRLFEIEQCIGTMNTIAHTHGRTDESQGMKNIIANEIQSQCSCEYLNNWICFPRGKTIRPNDQCSYSRKHPDEWCRIILNSMMWMKVP